MDPALPATTQDDEDRKSFFTCLTVVILIAIAATVVGALIVNANLGGDTLAVVPVRQQPQQVTFELAAQTRATVWAEVEVTHREISYMSATEDLPHVMDFVVEITRDGGQPLQRRCNPFDTNVSRTSYFGTIDGLDGRRYDGLIRNCSFDLQPGKYTLGVHAEKVKRDPRIVFRKKSLILRAK